MKRVRIISHRDTLPGEKGKLLVDWKYGKKLGGYLYLNTGTKMTVVGGDRRSLILFPVDSEFTFDQLVPVK